MSRGAAAGAAGTTAQTGVGVGAAYELARTAGLRPSHVACGLATAYAYSDAAS